MIEKSEKYWAELLEQYKLGSISDSDRFELEKKALDDPFLFDALEGFSIEMQEEIPLKTETKLLTLPRMAAAASLVFLVAMIFLLKNETTEEISNDQSIAMVLDKSIDESKVAPSDDDTLDNEVTDRNTGDAKETSTAEPKFNKTKNKTNEKSKKAKSTSNKKEEAKIIEESTTPISNRANETKNNVDQIIASDQIIEEIESADQVAADADEEIIIANSSRAFDASSNGSSDLDSSLLMATTDNEESMPTTNAKKVKKKEAPSTFYVVQPAIGQKDFDEYVKESIDRRGLRQEKPHDVTIEFNIDKNGTLSNFLHIYNGCSECGGYAIHLLSSSGVWKTTPEGQEGRARYTLKF